MKVREIVKNHSFIQAGAFRPDKGSIRAEFLAFSLGISIYKECLTLGKKVSFGVMVNDFGIKPDERPKKTGICPFSRQYLDLLQKAAVPVDSVLIFYETTLRNRSRKDAPISMKESNSGVMVPTCPSIMGRFYKNLEEMGFEQSIGFYTVYDCGPNKGAKPEISGYELKIEVVNYFVDTQGVVHDLSFSEQRDALRCEVGCRV